MMKIPRSAHTSKLRESGVKLSTSHGRITETVASHAERHTAKMDALRKEVEMANAIKQGTENMAQSL